MVLVNASATSIMMNDPALRVADKSFCADLKVSKPNERARKKYESSSVALPSIWGRKSLCHPRHLLTLSKKIVKSSLSRAELYAHRETTPYYPFCEELYQFATGKKKCDWIHCVHWTRLDTGSHTYSFPCGCTSPRFLNLKPLLHEFAMTMPRGYLDAVVLPNIRTEEGMAKFNTPGVGYFTVPRNQVFREASST